MALLFFSNEERPFFPHPVNNEKKRKRSHTWTCDDIAKPERKPQVGTCLPKPLCTPILSILKFLPIPTAPDDRRKSWNFKLRKENSVCNPVVPSYSIVLMIPLFRQMWMSVCLIPVWMEERVWIEWAPISATVWMARQEIGAMLVSKSPTMYASLCLHIDKST